MTSPQDHVPLSNEHFIFLIFAAKFCSLFLHLCIISHLLLFEDKDVPSHTKTSTTSASTHVPWPPSPQALPDQIYHSWPSLQKLTPLWATLSHQILFIFFPALMILCSSNLDFSMLSRWFFFSPFHFRSLSLSYLSASSAYILPRSLHLFLEFHFL